MAASTDYWPRVGYPLLPAVYRREWSHEALPSAVANKVGLPSGTTLADLDSTVWNRAQEPGALNLVANHVLALITRRLYFGSDSRAKELPILGRALPEQVELESLPFSTRTLNTLRHAGKLRDLDWAAHVTAAEFLALPSAGARTLLDFATVLEELYATRGGDVRGAASEPMLRRVLDRCDQLKREVGTTSISLKDPRIATSGVFSTLEETLEDWRAQARVAESGELDSLLRKLEQLRQELSSLKVEKLDEALEHLLRSITSEKYVAALAARFGWDGHGGCTLEKAAGLRNVTRERIRQVEQSALKKMPRTAYMPALDSALQILTDTAASFEPDMTAALMQAGVASKLFKPFGVLSAGKFLGREVDLVVSSDGLCVQKEGDESFTAISEAFKSLVNVNYVASVLELQARLEELGLTGISEDSTRSLVHRHPRSVWLDSEHQWFWIKQPEGRNRYHNAARKILSIAPVIRLDVLREGVLRHHRSKGMSLPRHAFEGFCRALGLRINATSVSSPELLKPADSLAPIEMVMHDALRDHENVLGLHDFRDLCVSAGVNRHSFYVYLSYSPIIARVSPSVWSLRGVDVDPTRVAQLLEEMPPNKKALQDHGWTPDGAVWVAYSVTRAVLDSGVLTIPPGVRDVLGEGKFELYAVDGARVGNVNVKKSSAWGLGPFMSRRGVELDDYIIVAVDAELQMAIVHAGSVELLESFQDNSGWGPRRLLSGAAPPMLEEGD